MMNEELTPFKKPENPKLLSRPTCTYTWLYYIYVQDANLLLLLYSMLSWKESQSSCSFRYCHEKGAVPSQTAREPGFNSYIWDSQLIGVSLTFATGRVVRFSTLSWRTRDRKGRISRKQNDVNNVSFCNPCISITCRLQRKLAVCSKYTCPFATLVKVISVRIGPPSVALVWTLWTPSGKINQSNQGRLSSRPYRIRGESRRLECTRSSAIAWGLQWYESRHPGVGWSGKRRN